MAGHVFETIQTLNQNGLTILLAGQDTRSTLAIADTAHVIKNGRIAMPGTGAQVANDPGIRQAYLRL